MGRLFSFPSTDGYRSVGEDQRHLATVIMYPERCDIWRNEAKYAQDLIIHIANTIVEFEPVLMCVKPHMVEQVRHRLNSHIKIFAVEYDDIWARDIGPNFVVKDSNLRAVNWQFNAWGGLEDGAYYPWNNDDAFAIRLSDYLGIDYYNVEDVVLEGGGVIIDSAGTLITTESVLLNKNRNPHKSKSYIETCLKQYYNADKVIWLPQGLELDETNGHIDNVCAFVGDGEICIAYTEDKNNIQYNVLQTAYKILSKETDAKGNKLIIHKLPLPTSQFITKEESVGILQTSSSTNRVEGFELIPSYLNYYLINGGVLVPSFGCDDDDKVKMEMSKIFPNREVILIPSKEILIGGGGFHCIMHEIPYANNIKW